MYMVQQPSVICESEEWLGAYPFFIIATVLFGVGIPALFTVLLVLNRKRLDTQSVEARLGVIYNRFKRNVFYWRVVLLLRKFMFVLIVTGIAADRPILQGLVGILVLGSVCILQVYTRPYLLRASNFVDFLGNMSIYVALVSGVCFASPAKLAEFQAPFDRDEMLKGLEMASVALGFISVLMGIAQEFYTVLMLKVAERRKKLGLASKSSVSADVLSEFFRPDVVAKVVQMCNTNKDAAEKFSVFKKISDFSASTPNEADTIREQIAAAKVNAGDANTVAHIKELKQNLAEIQASNAKMQQAIRDGQ